MGRLLSAVGALAISLVMAPGAAVATADDYRDIKTPMFATPKAEGFSGWSCRVVSCLAVWIAL